MRIKTWIGIALLLFAGIILYQIIQNNHQDYVERQKILDQEQARHESDQRFSDCMVIAKRDYVDREGRSCMAYYHQTTEYCFSNMPAILAGPIYDSYQKDKDNCSIQFPGAKIVN